MTSVSATPKNIGVAEFETYTTMPTAEEPTGTAIW